VQRRFSVRGCSLEQMGKRPDGGWGWSAAGAELCICVHVTGGHSQLSSVDGAPCSIRPTNHHASCVLAGGDARHLRSAVAAAVDNVLAVFGGWVRGKGGSSLVSA